MPSVSGLTENDAHQWRWKLEQKLQNDAMNQTLRGFKRILGFVEVRTMLQNRKAASDPDSISEWLKQCGVTLGCTEP